MSGGSGIVIVSQRVNRTIHPQKIHINRPWVQRPDPKGKAPKTKEDERREDKKQKQKQLTRGPGHLSGARPAIHAQIQFGGSGTPVWYVTRSAGQALLLELATRSRWGSAYKKYIRGFVSTA